VREHVLRREQILEARIEDAFAFFSRAENLEAITPPWLRFRIADPSPSELGEGTMIGYRLRLHGVPIRWLTRIEEWDPPERFVDRQVEGPYALWHHTHSFEPISENRTRMVDVVRYGHRLGPLGSLAQRLIVERDLRRIFDYRRDAIASRIQHTREGAPQ
jgi:ligand-binding SRPBCC domain-containing protein